MKYRTKEQIEASKAIYEKHAAKHKANDYPYHRCLRMIAYTAALTKATEIAMGARQQLRFFKECLSCGNTLHQYFYHKPKEIKRYICHSCNNRYELNGDKFTSMDAVEVNMQELKDFKRLINELN